MKCILYISDRKIAEKIKNAIIEIRPNTDVDITTSCIECFAKGKEYDCAFIDNNNQGLPWTDLMNHLAAQGVKVYFVGESATDSILQRIKEANGRSFISTENVNQGIRCIFEDFSEKDSNTKKSSDEEEKYILEASEMSLQEYLLLRTRNYPATIVSIHSGKSGVGKTNIAVNVAASLAKRGLKTALVDFDIENGNLSNVIHIISDKDLKDVIKGSFENIETSFDQHPSTGLYVLPGLKTHAESELITAAVCERILGKMARIFDVIIIDTGALEIDPMLVAMQLATISYLITTYDMTVVSKTYDLIEDAKILNVDIDKFKIVVNRVPNKMPIEKPRLADYISVPLLTEIHECEGILAAINGGELAIDSQKCSTFTEGIKTIVNDIMQTTDIGNKVSEKSEEITTKKRGLHKLWGK